MSKVLTFFYDHMADFEVTFVLHLLRYNAKKEIVPIAYEQNNVISESGISYAPAATIREALNYEDVEGMIIPGGWNDEQRGDLNELIQRLDKEKKLLAAICAGPQYLARAGVLEGRAYTTTLTEEHLQSLKKEDPFPRSTYRHENVVRDGHIITAVGSSFIDFALEVADWFKMIGNQDELQMLRKIYQGLTERS